MILDINYNHDVITLIDNLVINMTEAQWFDENYLSGGNFQEGSFECSLQGLKGLAQGLGMYLDQIKATIATNMEGLAMECSTASASTGMLYAMHEGETLNLVIDRIVTLDDLVKSVKTGDFDLSLIHISEPTRPY